MKRPLSVRRDPMLKVAHWLMYGALACSSGKATVREGHDFSDAGGRICRATLEKTSADAPALSESVECDSGARQCSSESTSCFELSIASQNEGYQIRNCPACCKGNASSFVAANCSAVVCKSDADCIFAQAKCQAGLCICPAGFCD
jgi:hypothetical protein